MFNDKITLKATRRTVADAHSAHQQHGSSIRPVIECVVEDYDRRRKPLADDDRQRLSAAKARDIPAFAELLV